MNPDFQFYLTLEVNHYLLTFDKQNEINGINFIESKLWDEERNTSWQKISKLVFLKQLKFRQIIQTGEIPIPYIQINSSKKLKGYLDILKICAEEELIKNLEFSFNGERLSEESFLEKMKKELDN